MGASSASRPNPSSGQKKGAICYPACSRCVLLHTPMQRGRQPAPPPTPPAAAHRQERHALPVLPGTVAQRLLPCAKLEAWVAQLQRLHSVCAGVWGVCQVQCTLGRRNQIDGGLAPSVVPPEAAAAREGAPRLGSSSASPCNAPPRLRHITQLDVQPASSPCRQARWERRAPALCTAHTVQPRLQCLQQSRRSTARCVSGTALLPAGCRNRQGAPATLHWVL